MVFNLTLGSCTVHRALKSLYFSKEAFARRLHWSCRALAILASLSDTPTGAENRSSIFSQARTCCQNDDEESPGSSNESGYWANKWLWTQSHYCIQDNSIKTLRKAFNTMNAPQNRERIACLELCCFLQQRCIALLHTSYQFVFLRWSFDQGSAHQWRRPDNNVRTAQPELVTRMDVDPLMATTFHLDKDV